MDALDGALPPAPPLYVEMGDADANGMARESANKRREPLWPVGVEAEGESGGTAAKEELIGLVEEFIARGGDATSLAAAIGPVMKGATVAAAIPVMKGLCGQSRAPISQRSDSGATTLDTIAEDTDRTDTSLELGDGSASARDADAHAPQDDAPASASEQHRRRRRSFALLEAARAAEASARGLVGGRAGNVGAAAARRHAGDSGNPKRDVMRAAAAVAFYMAAGVLFYSLILPERWPPMDALYFSMTTFTTVGYGDIVPKSQAGRGFTSLYALCGVAVIGNLLSYFGEKVARQSAASAQQAAERNDDKFEDMLRKGHAHRSSRRLGGVDAGAAREARQKPATERTFLQDNWVFIPLLVVFSVVSYLEIGLDQGYTFVDVVYYTIATLTTIGYGDISPNDQFTRGLAIVLIPLSTISMATLIGRFAEFQLHKREVRRQAKKWEKGFNKDDLTKMDEDGDGQVSKKEFVYFMLISSEKATQGYLYRLEKLFDELDDDGSGYLDENDFLTQIEQSNKKLLHEVGNRIETE